jgi:hypothetical protein
MSILSDQSDGLTGLHTWVFPHSGKGPVRAVIIGEETACELLVQGHNSPPIGGPQGSTAVSSTEALTLLSVPTQLNLPGHTPPKGFILTLAEELSWIVYEKPRFLAVPFPFSS